MFKSMSSSVSRSPFALLLGVAFLGLAVLAQQISFSPPVRAASTAIVISEVDANPPLAGTDTANEWFELQNVSAGSITLTNWTITDNVTSDTIPTVTIGPGGHVIVAATEAGFASEHPGFTGTVLTVADGAIGNGLANGGDALVLQDSSAVVVDSLSWGTNSTVLNPSAGIDSTTDTNQRNAAGTDTDTAADWTRASENPNGNTNVSPTPTNPTGLGAANPSALPAGNQTLLTVTVSPGSNPASTGLSVSGNLSSIGGSATQQFFDDGTNGDVVVGNNVFSYSATVSVATTPGAKTIPFSITDAQSRSASGNVSLTVTPVRDPAEHMVMGNPSNALADPSMTTNYLMMKPQYALSYNNDKGTPNWTSWHLDSTWTTGVADRQEDFRPDDTLPLSFKHVSNGYQFATYGFDRGHMCPSADRTSSVADNSATFLMTNMVPQAAGNNQEPWASLETYIRTQLSGAANELYIISGGTGIGGHSSTGPWDNIIDTAGNTVTVPQVTWKVVMVLPNVSGDDAARVSTSTRTFAVIMPNNDNIRPDQWQKYLATVDQVEALSGYDFYSNVPTAVQDVIEARLDAENDTAPFTSDQTKTTVKDQQVAVTLSATDVNINNTFTYSIVDAPLHGSLSGSNGNLTYSPNPNYVGPDLFTYKANDGAKDSNVSTVTIMVNEPPFPICSSVLNNAEWIIQGLDSSIPESPFQVMINGNPVCTTKLLAFGNRVPDTSRFPQVFDLYSSGYIRMKAGADPSPPLPFGQSLVLGPAIFGTSASFPATTLFFHPQLQGVDIDTSQLNPDGTGTLLISVTANDSGLAPTSTNTNQIMNQTWVITLQEPTNEQTRIDVAGTFSFTETANPDETRSAEFQSFRLLQISSMFIDSARHDVDAFRYHSGTGLVTFPYNPGFVNTLLPPTPSALDPSIRILDSLHTDDLGQPNGNTPSYRILMGTTTGPMSGPITPRAVFDDSQDVNDDNLGLWLHQQPFNVIPQGTSGSISYAVVATTDPLPPITWQPVVLTEQQIDQLKAWTTGGRTFIYVRPKFPDAGYRILTWGQPTRTGNDFTVDANAEKFTGPSIQAITTTAQIYDLGPLADGTYNFNFRTSGTLSKALQFTVGGAAPPPNPIDDQRQFVRQQYLDFLNREPDGPGWDFWTDNITKCSDPARRPPLQTEAECTSRQRETTSAAFFISPEFQNTGYFVLRVFRGALGRFPYFGGSVPADNIKDEFTRDHAQVSAGIVVNNQLDPAVINANKQAFVNQFVSRSEFLAIYGALNHTDYVDRLFQTTAVAPTPEERTALIDGLGNGSESRASVLFKIVDGTQTGAGGALTFQTRYGQLFYAQQFNSAFVQMEYFGYMKRDPDEAGYAFWLNKLNSYPSFAEAEMVLAFILSPEYRSRFGQP